MSEPTTHPRRGPARLHLALLLGAAAMTAGTPPSAAADPAPPSGPYAPASAAAPAASAAPPAMTRYQGTVSALLTYRRELDYGGTENYAVSTAELNVSGTMPSVRFAGASLVGSAGGAPPRISGNTYSKTVTDDGGTVVVCAGESVHPATNVPPIFQRVAGKNVLYAFNSVGGATICSSNQEPGEYPGQFGLPALPVWLSLAPSVIGDPTIRLPFDHSVVGEPCPGYTAPYHVDCTYRIRGTLTLRRVPDIDVFKAPTGARLAERASRASVRAGCAVACTATVTVTPLRGGGSATVRRSIAPGASQTLTVGLRGRLQQSIMRSHGAVMTVVYRSDDATQAFTRTVRT